MSILRGIPSRVVRGIRDSIPSGHMIGRASSGDGPAEIIPLANLGEALVAVGSVAPPSPTVSLTDAHIFVGNSSNIATDVAMSGDVHIDDTGSTTIQPHSVTLAKLQNATGSSKLIGSGSSGSGSSYAELSVTNNLTISPTTVDLSSTTVTAGSYTNANITVDAKGRITVASSGSSSAGFELTDGVTDLTSTTKVTVSNMTVGGSSAAATLTPKTATASILGVSKPDGTTISISGGVLTAVAGASGINQLTGDVTAGPGTGSQASTIAGNAVTTTKINANAVTYAKLQQSAGNAVLVGAQNASSNLGEITLGTNLTMSGGVLNASGGGSGTTTTTPVSWPQGRLTLQSGSAVMTADAIGVSTVYYDAYNGGLVPVYNGSGWAYLAIASNEVSMGLDAVTPHIAANAVYDIFAINNSGSLVIAAGPAWINTATITVTIATPAVVSWTGHGLAEGAPVVFTTTGALPTGITAGTTYFVGKSPGTNSFNISTTVANAAAGTFVATSGSQSGTHTGTNNTSTRGTGAGTSELQQLNGLWTNKNALTHAWGGASGTTDYGSVSANQATYLGTFYATANGQTGAAFYPAAASGGTNNIVGIWNAYNRVSAYSRAQDSTTTWTYTTATFRAANGSVSNRISWVDGLAQTSVSALYLCDVKSSSGANGARLGVLYDGTTVSLPNCESVYVAFNQSTANETTLISPKTPSAPLLGFHYVQALEFASGGTQTFTGRGADQQLVLDLNY